MHNFKIRFKFDKHFFKTNLYLGRIKWRNVKSDLFSKINQFLRSMTQRFDLNNYKYITRFKFCLFLNPLLILTRTPFNE